MIRTVLWISVMAFCGALHAAGSAKGAACDVKPPEVKKTVKPSRYIVLTEAARVELKDQKHKKWRITYNGTCGDAPALGFYQDDGESLAGAVTVQQEGAVIRIEQKILALLDEWGAVTVNCIDYNGDKPGGKQFTAELKKDP